MYQVILIWCSTNDTKGDPMSLKKLFIIALAVGGLSAALQVDAHARPHGHGHKVMKMMLIRLHCGVISI